MKVDVILPTYNRGHILERAIQSVLKQTYSAFNLYVIDDGSTDNTSEILNKYTGRPNVFSLYQENRGVSAARNLGIKSSYSPWIAFLDSDDEWLPHKLEVQMDLIKKNPLMSFFHSNEMWIRNGTRVNSPKRFDKSNHEIFKRSLETCLISPSTVIMKRDLLEKKGYFDEEMIICEDYDLWLKILSTEVIMHCEEYLIKKYGGHEDQLSTRFPAMDFWRLHSLERLAHQNISPDKKELVIREINKKAPILLQGLLKHEKLEQHYKLLKLIGPFLRTP